MLRPHILAAVASSALVATACGGNHDAAHDSGVESCPIGDLASAVELEIVNLDANGQVIQTQDMAQVPLVVPPQGGWAVALGARARNIDCRLTLKTALTDLCTSRILATDSRDTHLDLGADGWGLTTLNSFSALQVCSVPAAVRDTNDVPYSITVSIADSGGYKASKSITVVPTCPTDGANATCCAVQCNDAYSLGDPCDMAPPTVHQTCPPAAAP